MYRQAGLFSQLFTCFFPKTLQLRLKTKFPLHIIIFQKFLVVIEVIIIVGNTRARNLKEYRRTKLMSLLFGVLTFM